MSNCEGSRSTPPSDAHKALVHEVCDRMKFFERDARCFMCAPEVETPHGKGVPGCYAVASETVSIVLRAKESVALSEKVAITDNDKRWRFLEHGCQWVSWAPTGGDTVSFDPRDVKHLQAMRASADKTLHEQVALLRAEADAIERRMKK
jgi:hypothetical protein